MRRRNIDADHAVTFDVTNSEEVFLTIPDDEMELAFIEDFVKFGSQLAVSAAFVLLGHASGEEIERKRIATSILLQSYIALEDFAILLRAMMKRRKGTYLHLAMSEGEPGGTTQYPAILKKPVTAREVFDELGFDAVTVERLRRVGYEATEANLNASFSDFFASIKQLSEYVSAYNSLKNRLKHGKGVFGVAFGLDGNGCVAHLEVADDATKAKPIRDPC